MNNETESVRLEGGQAMVVRTAFYRVLSVYVYPQNIFTLGMQFGSYRPKSSVG